MLMTCELQVVKLSENPAQPWAIATRFDTGENVLVPHRWQSLYNFALLDRFEAEVCPDPKGFIVVNVTKLQLPPPPPPAPALVAPVSPPPFPPAPAISEPEPEAGPTLEDYAAATAVAEQVVQKPKPSQTALGSWQHTDGDGKKVPLKGTRKYAIYKLRTVKRRAEAAIAAVDEFFDECFDVKYLPDEPEPIIDSSPQGTDGLAKEITNLMDEAVNLREKSGG